MMGIFHQDRIGKRRDSICDGRGKREAGRSGSAGMVEKNWV